MSRFGLFLPFGTQAGEPRSARPRVGAQPLVVVTLSRKILERLCGLGGCKSARPGGGRALRGGAHARLYSAHWHQDLNDRSRPNPAALPPLSATAAPAPRSPRGPETPPCSSLPSTGPASPTAPRHSAPAARA